jgi:hypothetical protein
LQARVSVSRRTSAGRSASAGGALHPDAAGVADIAGRLTAAVDSAFPSRLTQTGSAIATHRILVPVLAVALAASVVAFSLLRRKARTRTAQR